MKRIPVHYYAPTVMAVSVALLGALTGYLISGPAAWCLGPRAPQLEQSLDGYPYGCYGALRYDAMQQEAPSCTPDVNRRGKGDAR